MKSFILALLLSSVLNEVAYGSLNCDSVEYSIRSSFGYTDNYILAAGVCIPENPLYGGATMYACNGNDKINVLSYNSNDCSGNPWDVQSLYDSLTSYSNVTSYSVTCCTGNQCPYALVKDYYIDSCSQDIEGVDFTADSYVIGSCLPTSWDSTKYASCSNGQLIEEEYYSSDCSGIDPMSTNNINVTNCDDDTYPTRKEVTCGTAIDTCSDSFSYSTTKKPFRPSISGGTGSGTAPTKSLDCDGIEIEVDTVNMAIPTGVCVNVEQDISYELKCDSNDQISYYLYRNKDCAGDSLLSGDISIGTTNLMNTSVNVFNSVCNKGPCNYGLVRAYNMEFDDESECDEFESSLNKDTAYFQQVFVSGYCMSVMQMGSISVVCDGDTVTANEYLGGKCNGISLQHQEIASDSYECIDGDLGSSMTSFTNNDTITSFRAVQVSCGVADDTKTAPIVLIVSITGGGLCLICLCCIFYCGCRRRGSEKIKWCQICTNILMKSGSVQIEFNQLNDNLTKE